MNDPPRFSSQAGSPEALLVASAPGVEPPLAAQDELWRRLQDATGAAAVGTAALAAHRAASIGAKVAGPGFWTSVVKWSAVVALGAPVAGVVAHGVLARSRPLPLPVAPHIEATPSKQVALAPAPSAASDVSLAPVADQAPQPARTAAAGLPQTNHVSPERMTPSELTAESRLLGEAKARLAAGDARGALEGAAQLSARFPRGRLFQEREILAIDALQALGQDDAARTRALSFLARYPSSPYASHLRQKYLP
jgi:hypothetical protein